MPRRKKERKDTARSERLTCIFFSSQVLVLLALIALKTWYAEPVTTLFFVYVLATVVMLLVLWLYDRRAFSESIEMLARP